jgi:DNA-binding CsgD family transcriptional regulator
MMALTEHELYILSGLRTSNYKELAVKMNLKENTLRQIMVKAFLKLGTDNLRDAQSRAARRGLIPKAR